MLGDDDLDEVGSVLLWSSVEPVSAVKRSLGGRSTLGSRFFSGLCQVPAHKMVSGGFPRVFRFPQLLL